ncbi:sortase-dependent protein [Streptomyces sp. NPDC094034]|uniref:sortase-dependent protein n=1 Tax=Streptomyces sp. NPDC094034 TaxID=3155309 RepID=UPI003322AEA1
MRRIILSATALACTAVLASTVPAFADETPSPQASRPATTAPAPVGEPAEAPTTYAKPAEAPAKDAGPAEVPARDQVSVVPSGAPDTGVALVSTRSGSDAGLIGGGAAAALVAGGAAVFVLRRRRTTGA